MDPQTQATTAVQILTPLVDGTQVDQLDNQTPCAKWKVRDLLNHVIGGGYMFTAGLRGDAFDGGVGLGGPLGGVGRGLLGVAQKLLTDRADAAFSLRWRAASKRGEGG